MALLESDSFYREKNQSLLVVGGTGFIGRALMARAVEKGFEVSSIGLHPPSLEQAVSGVSYVYADLANREELMVSLTRKSFSYLVNLGGYIDHSLFLEGGRYIVENQFLGLLNLLEVIELTELEKFVQIGTGDEYGSALSPISENQSPMPKTCYALSRLNSLELLKTLNRSEKLAFIYLRLFLVYGPGQGPDRLIPSILNGCFSKKPFPVSKGEQIRDFCYVDDVVEAILAACNAPSRCIGEVYNVGSGIPVSVRDVINELVDVVGFGEPTFGGIATRPTESQSLYPDIGKIQSHLNWSPTTNLRQGLTRTKDAFVSGSCGN